MREQFVRHAMLERENIYERLRVAMNQYELGAPLATEEVITNLARSLPKGYSFDAKRGRISGSGILPWDLNKYLERLDREVSRVMGNAPKYFNKFKELDITQERFEAVKASFAFESSIKLETDPAGPLRPVPIVIMNELYEIAGFTAAFYDRDFADLMDRDLVRTTKKQLESWLVSMIHTTPGSYHEPPMTDIVDIRTFPTLVDAICFVQGECIKLGVRNYMEAESMEDRTRCHLVSKDL